MNKLIALTLVATLAATSAAQAGGFFFKRTSVLSGITGIAAGVNTGHIGVLNGTTVAVGNNSNILSGNAVGNNALNGNSVLSGIGIVNGSSVLGILGNRSAAPKRR